MNIYVHATSGNDNNDGSAERPVRSMDRAGKIATAYFRATGHTAVVHIGGGNFAASPLAGACPNDKTNQTDVR